MDPQQRLALQAAYQAMEQAGYYAYDLSPKKQRSQHSTENNHIGVYVGVTVDDYQSHIRSHPANAFSATGIMRSFIAGKISHHFGWTGPAITVDTACSSSAVAIHTACRDLLAGECTAALAGAVNVITNPLAFQDLAAAGFLSPSGQCKPFDDSADGYCRGEAVGLVLLKRYSDALADGNQIFGCISGSAIYQNQNHTPIFAPNSPSLLSLFKNVMQKAEVQPSDITVVEFHGTGTKVGDPAEWEGVHHALGGPPKVHPVYIGSAKGHVGHTEAASGVVALIKVLVMMQRGYIPPQASYSSLSRLIQPSDRIQVATSQVPWHPTRKIALINNYGASGCNGAMVVTNSISPQSQAGRIKANATGTLPFCISGHTVNSIKAKCARIQRYLDMNPEVGLADLSFNMYRQSSRSLGYRFTFQCDTLEGLRMQLRDMATVPSGHETDSVIKTAQPDRPVILCFGGQFSQVIGLDRNLYDQIAILRYYLDQCDAAIQSLGLESIFPDIFSRHAAQDQQHFQTMLFAMQYSCAMCWMKSGLSCQVVAVVGHSFGELTAMAITGILSLHDAVKLVAGRAGLVRDLWGSDPGVMLAVETDKKTVDALLFETSKVYSGSHPPSIACYNGPRSFTIAGCQEAIDTVTGLLSQKFPTIRSKILPVTNAFHSSLVNPLVRQLELLGQDITFQKPYIPLERATETRIPLEFLGPSYVAEHMTQPVFFSHAVQRLAQDHPNCIWLEAGSNSTVTTMAQMALGSDQHMAHYFQDVRINHPDAFSYLSEVTVSLWKEGVSTSFWPHNAHQTHEYGTLVLPPYQFEMDKHWLELKMPVKQDALSDSPVQRMSSGENHDARWVFMGYKGAGKDEKRYPYFHINTMARSYQELVAAHVVANTAGICSGWLQADLAMGSLYSIHPSWAADGVRATLHNMVIHAPIVANSLRTLSLEFEDRGNGFWDWKIVGLLKDTPSILHSTGRLQVRDRKDTAYKTEFRRLARLIDHTRCLSLLRLGHDHDDAEILQGRSIYYAFRNIVDFGEPYQSLRWLVGRGSESAGRLCRTEKNDTWFDQLRGEHIFQVGGIWLNCMTAHDPEDLFVGAEIETWMISPDRAHDSLPAQCDVFARHLRDEKTGDHITDSFVFDSTSGELIEVTLGARFVRTPSSSFIQALRRVAPSPLSDERHSRSSVIPQRCPAPVSPSQYLAQEDTATKKAQNPEHSGPDLIREMRQLVANLVGINVTEIDPDSYLPDCGVDSLLVLELQAGIKRVFGCALDQVAIIEATTVRELVGCLSIAMGVPRQDMESSLTPQQPTDNLSSDEMFSASHSTDFPSNQESKSTNCLAPTGSADILWSTSDVLESFSATKKLGDQMIVEYGLDNLHSLVIPDSNRLSAALVLECFEELGCPLQNAREGEDLKTIPFQPEHRLFVKYIYRFLQEVLDLVTLAGDEHITRTKTPAPITSSQTILHELLEKHPQQEDYLRLSYHVGIHLARALTGLTDGNRVLMSSPEGRRLCESVYHNHALNRLGFETMRDVLDRLCGRMRRGTGPLHVLELGGGTGSATSVLAPLLASWDIPVEYTFTDISSSLVAQARRTLGAQYPFMKFAVQDIEKPVDEGLAGQQHIVIASQAVHATRSLTDSTRMIRQALRPDGFLMMFEMREAWPAVDLSFGLYEGWWMFEDGRTHAYASHQVWQRSLAAAGYGAVDWTDGMLPEHRYFMVIVALASKE